MTPASPSAVGAPARVAAFACALVAVGALLLMGFRVALLLQYRPDIGPPAAELARAFWMGLRFDFKMMATLAAPLLLVGWALRWAGPRATTFALAAFGALAFVLVNLLGVVNHYYFGFFGSTIDPMIFGLFEDDTQIVFHTVWNDYPILRILAAWIGASLALCWLALRVARPLARAFTRRPALCYIATILVIALLARGSLGTFALGTKHLSVSSDAFANQLVPNALEATYLALKNRLEASLSDDPLTGLRSYGFRTPQQAAAALGLPPASSEDELIAQLYTRTPLDAQLAARPPHVVFAMMESLGRHVLEGHSPANNLYGRLERHLREDFSFRHFVSGQHGTHRTFESLLMNSPVTPITQGRYGYHTFAAAAAEPFRRAGYRTVFLTSGPASWRNIADILRHQGFTDVLDVSHLRARYPDAPFNIRGAPDALSFRYARELLEDGDRAGQPVFVFVFTTNNHPPHLVPEGYRPLPLDLSAYGARAPADAAMGARILATVQYANDALGGLLDEIKSSPLADRTVLAASGDHNTRNFFVYTGHRELPLAYGVPAYLYLPPALRAKVHFDPQRFGSHRDLFPTLYRRALSGACYLAVGNDLLAPAGAAGGGMATAPGAGLAVYDYLLTAEGGVAGLKGEPQFLQWDDGARTRLVPFAGPVPESLQERVRRERAYVALLDWQTRVQALQHRPAEPPCP